MRWLLALWIWLLPSLAFAGGQPAVAVLYFRNQGNPELEVFRVGLAEMLASDLAGTPGVRIIERVEVQATLDELELGHSGIVDPTTAARIGKLVGARWLLMGSYFEFQGTLRIDARLVNVETGVHDHAKGFEGPSGSMMALRREVVADMRGALTTLAGESTGAAPSPSPPARPTAALVVAPDGGELEAAVAFSEGLIALDRKDVTRARESFERALVADPDLALARAELEALGP